MKLDEIIAILDCEIYHISPGYDREILNGSASDLMSDVLTCTTSSKILLTGLNTPQIIRTASVLDLPAVIVTRGKKPDPLTVELAKTEGVSLLGTTHTSFTSAALLYQAGLRGVDGLEEF